MKSCYLIVKVVVTAIFCLSFNITLKAQSISGVEAIPPDAPGSRWEINIAFVPVPEQTKIKQIFLINIEDARIIKLENLGPNTIDRRIYTATSSEPLQTKAGRDSGSLQFAKLYELRAGVENDKGDILSLGAHLELLDPNKAENQEGRVQSVDAEDSDIYISGEVNGAHQESASFTTEIKLQKYKGSTRWRTTPFFNMNASTDPDADPDQMQIGFRFRYITNPLFRIPGAYFDSEIKIESERDFDNTNFIYHPRFTFLVPSFPKGFKTRKQDSTITTNNYKVFFNPIIGGEFGKNLRSPLQAAEGDGIARLLAGAELRFAFFLKKQDEPDLNWATSYARRWLLTDELGFKTDSNGDLVLDRFDKGPRDHVLSRLSYRLTKYFDVFAAYEWGQVPPSYKLVDHRFRLGFAYKYSFAVQ